MGFVVLEQMFLLFDFAHVFDELFYFEMRSFVVQFRLVIKP